MLDPSAIERIADGEEAPPAELLAQSPRGALALAGVTVGLLVLAWLAIYLFVFLPRGPVS
jgi:predicted nucleic acid-binding protein